MTLTRDQILGAEDRETRDVDVPEWGGSIRIRSLSGADRARLEAFSVKQTTNGVVDTAGMREHYVALSAIGESGSPLFEQSDLPVLGEKSAAALDRVVAAIIELNGLSAEEVDDLEGN